MGPITITLKTGVVTTVPALSDGEVLAVLDHYARCGFEVVSAIGEDGTVYARKVSA